MIQSCTSFHFKERYKVIVFDMVAIFFVNSWYDAAKPVSRQYRNSVKIYGSGSAFFTASLYFNRLMFFYKVRININAQACTSRNFYFAIYHF
jgi:hypothetical protein